MTDLALASGILVLDPGDMAEQIATMADDDLDSLIEITDNAATANRIARIERGRRTQNLRGMSNPEGHSFTDYEKKKRHEERKVAEWFDSTPDAEKTVEEHGWKKLVAIARGLSPHVLHNSADDEWCTPPEYTTAAREVMGGIDLDPASSAIANEVVKATVYFDAQDDGLSRPWAGRVWMNPPYSKGQVWPFCEKLSEHFAADDISQACVLVNNATETAAFQRMAELASAICFPARRIKFWHPDKDDTDTPLQGQAVLYFGPNTDGFVARFVDFGFTATL